MDYGDFELERATSEGMLPPLERRQDHETRRAYTKLSALANEYGINQSLLRDACGAELREIYLDIMNGFRKKHPGERLADGFGAYAQEHLVAWKRLLDDYRQDSKDESSMVGGE